MLLLCVTPMLLSAKTLEEYVDAANNGDAEAQFHLGKHYAAMGDTIHKATVVGHRNGKTNTLSWTFRKKGQGSPMNDTIAFEWYEKSANQGYVLAQVELGFCYMYGLGVGQDCAKALGYYHKAAEQNNAIAQRHLGKSYYYGIGMTSGNDSIALCWYRRAAENGDVSSMTRVGDC